MGHGLESGDNPYESSIRQETSATRGALGTRLDTIVSS